MKDSIWRWTAAGLIGVAALFASATAPASAASSSPSLGWAKIAAQTLPATVNIQVSKVALADTDPDTGETTTPGERSTFFGSGFIVDPTGLIVTNKHVINNALSIVVTLQDGTEAGAKVIGTSPLIDLALLKINVGHPLPTLKFGDGDAVQLGDPVLAIGDPLGVGTSLSSGIVSGTRRDLMNSPFDDYVQTDAAINHGNSGGPLVDAEGDVIGVNSILYTNESNEGSNGVGFAISSKIVAIVVSHLRHPPDRFGWIGLHLQSMTPDLSRALRAPKYGSLVTHVDANSAASGTGINVGDVILGFNGERPSNPRELMALIATAPIDAQRELDVWSKTGIRKVDVTVRAWREPKQSDDDSSNQSLYCSPNPQRDLGLLLQPITPLDRQLYNLGNTSGLLLAAVSPTSEAYSAGFRPGVVIERIDDQTVTTTEAAHRILDDASTHSTLVALLVDWSKGPSWFTLHTGYVSPTDAASTEVNSPCAPDVTSSPDQASTKSQTRLTTH
jgi:serine protease Do